MALDLVVRVISTHVDGAEVVARGAATGPLGESLRQVQNPTSPFRPTQHDSAERWQCKLAIDEPLGCAIGLDNIPSLVLHR